MRRLFLIVTLPCLFLMPGCTQLGQAKEMISGVYGQVQDLKAEVAENKEEMAEIRVLAEESHGALDSDGDGSVSMEERARFVGSVTKGAAMGNKEDQERLLDWQFWLMIAVGGPTATGGAVLAAKKFKKTFMNSGITSGNGSG